MTEESAATSYDSLKVTIARQYGSLSGQLQRIARFLLENPNDSALDTVTVLAEKVGVQPSSFIRFAKAIGYEGFSDLQQVFRQRLLDHQNSYRERIKRVRAGHHSEQSVLHDFVEAGIESLHNLEEQVSTAQLSEAAEMLVKADTVFLIAQNRAFPVTFYMAYALNRLEKRCRLLDGVGGMLEREAALATERDVFVAVSFKPYSPQVVEIVVEQGARGIPVIAITDSALSPLAIESSLVFELQDTSRQEFRTLAAPLCLAQSLVVAAGHLLAAATDETSKSTQPA